MSTVLGAAGLGAAWGWLLAMAWVAARGRRAVLVVVAVLPVGLAWAFGGVASVVGCVVATCCGLAGHAALRWGGRVRRG